jgi:uncharacterized membrane protein
MLPTKDLYSVSLASFLWANIIKNNRLLISRRKCHKNGYCHYFKHEDKIIGYYIYFVPYHESIYFEYYRHGQPLWNSIYKIDLENEKVYKRCMSIFASIPEYSSVLYRWRHCVKFDNPHGELLHKIFDPFSVAQRQNGSKAK